MSRNKVRSVLATITVVAILLAGVTLYCGYEKKEVYSSTETRLVEPKNAYVGGDAYNYIINGTYFTGYMVQGMGYLIIATMSGIANMILGIKSESNNKIDEVHKEVKKSIVDDNVPEL